VIGSIALVRATISATVYSVATANIEKR